jgi:hypothetical protein
MFRATPAGEGPAGTEYVIEWYTTHPEKGRRVLISDHRRFDTHDKAVTWAKGLAQGLRADAGMTRGTLSTVGADGERVAVVELSTGG